MKKKAVRLMAILTAAALFSTGLAGCAKRSAQETETQKQTAADVVKVTEQATEKPEVKTEKQTEAVTESESQKLITSVDYTSKNGSIKITLPDNTWKVIQDTDEKRAFQAGNAARINIDHATSEAAMASLTLMTSEDELKKSLTEQYSDADAYEIKSFKAAKISDVDTYRYVVKYNTEARMWAYSVTYGIVAKDQAYTITGVVTDDNKTLLTAVQESVESFRVLNDEVLKTVTGELLSGTTKKSTETVKSDTKAEEELKTLTDYGTTAKLVTNDNVNVRLKPGTDSDVLTSLDKNVSVDVVGETANWFKVNILGNIGYIRKDFLVYGTTATTESESNAQTNAPETSAPSTDGSASAELNTRTDYGTSTTLYTTETVNLRSQPGTSSDVVNQIGGGQTVTVVGETDNWYIVSVNGQTGYISKPYLSSSQPTQSDNGGNGGGDNGGNGGGDNGGNGGGASQVTYVGGVVTSATADTLTVYGDDGNTYTIYYADADVSSADGIYTDVYVTVNLDPTQAGGSTLYATSVTGY